MVKRFVFFVNAAYCYPIYRPLQEVLWQEGHEVAWFFLRELSPQLLENEKLLSNEKEVKEFQPDVMFGAGDWLPYYLPGLKVMLFHGLSINKRGTERNAHYRIRGWYDLYCTHAEEDTKIFSELAQQHKNFRVAHTGWPKLDPLFSHKKNDNSGKELKTLFFASTFSPSITAAPHVKSVLKEIADTVGWRVIATLHPLMEPEILAQYKALSSKTFTFLSAEDDLYEAMMSADVMLCDTSSIMYEFMFLDKPVVTYKTKNPGPFVANVDEVQDVLPTIEKVVQGAPKQLDAARKTCAELHSFSDGRSSERVLEAVLVALAQGDAGLKPKPLNLLRKFKLRKRLGYWG